MNSFIDWLNAKFSDTEKEASTDKPEVSIFGKILGDVEDIDDIAESTKEAGNVFDQILGEQKEEKSIFDQILGS